MRLVLAALLFCASAAHADPSIGSGQAGPWPAGKACAVSLTYDDALDSQILNAALDLDQRGLKGTFFITGSSHSVSESPKSWAALATHGHELGAHTMSHPCGGSTGAWLAEKDRLEAFDLKRMAKELDDNIKVLRDLGGKAPFSFAYPCGQDWVGPDHDSYRPLVEERFSAARGVMNGSSDPKDVDLFNTRTYNPAGQSLAMLKAVVDDARSRGDWLIFMFHGVGGDYITTDSDVHAALLDYLKESKDVWVAPFGVAAEAVKKARGE
jgi:peptidoglycan/xylan/chitin deacetylase (PgdA/CDA1 family)